MAAPMKKRPHDVYHENESENSNKKPKTSGKEPDIDVDDKRLHSFLNWCEGNNFNLTSKVTVQKKGSCAQYGMIALEDIAEGYCLFQVPRSCLLIPENTNISHLIEGDAGKLDVQNKWIPLLIALIHEQNSNSKWRPYLDLVPDYDAIDLPLFWDRSSIENLLTNSKVDDAVTRDLKMIQDDFDNVIVPFFQRRTNIGSDLKDVEHFKKMVAFVMSYSFTEPAQSEKANNSRENCEGNDDDGDSSDDDEESEKMSPPMMVPMADMLNHVTQHNAKLTFGKEALKMVTIRKITKGEEIFNTYGEVSNLHLMHMYGFAEQYPENIHDVVEIPVSRLLEAAKQEAGKDEDASDYLDQKWKCLMDQEVFIDDDILVLNREGILTDDTCMQALKILCMNPAEFAEHQERDGWSDAESDSSLSGNSKLAFEKICTLDDKQISLLKRMAQVHLDKYHTSLAEDNQKLEHCAALPSRDKYAVFLVHGQKMLLQRLIDACIKNCNKDDDG